MKTVVVYHEEEFVDTVVEDYEDLDAIAEELAKKEKWEIDDCIVEVEDE